MKKVKRKFYNIIDSMAFRLDLQRRAEQSNDRCKYLEQEKLTKDEKKAIKAIWGDYGGKYYCHGFYKSFCGFFNPYYVPDDYYDYAEHVLNLRWSAYFMQHKCNLKFFIPDSNRAKVIVQKIDGHYVWEDNTEIPESEAINCLKKHSVFIAKKARGTGGGKGVRKIELNTVTDQDALFADLLKPNDMEFEEVIQQNGFMSQFNPDSVNTFRFVTLNINGNCTVLSTFLRMGSKGSFVDNLSGGDGVLVGIRQDGTFHEYGITKKFEKRYESPTGVAFKNLTVPCFEKIKQQMIKFQQKIPFANLIGWDVALDKENNVVIVEMNLDSAVIAAHQVFNGPLFGDRFREVKDYIDKRKSSLLHQMMTY